MLGGDRLAFRLQAFGGGQRAVGPPVADIDIARFCLAENQILDAVAV
jgi:hypothetical protein